METIISIENFKKIINNPDYKEWYDLLVELLPNYDINNTLRLSHFLAQVSHESGDFLKLKENMNYSAEGLSKTFPKRFPSAKSALHLHRQPEKIANAIYCNRMGNGAENSGDGWKYIGRGLIHITGKSNYIDCSKGIFGDERLVTHPEILSDDKRYALMSACWFWIKSKLNDLADDDDIVNITKKINGGVNGIDDRKKRYEKIKNLLK
jgi:putative chitinase